MLAGAEMIFDRKEKGYGGKGFTCRDPEGYIWNIGTYNPWETADRDFHRLTDTANE